MFTSLFAGGLAFYMEGFFFRGSRLFLIDVKSPGGGELSLSAYPRGGK